MKKIISIFLCVILMITPVTVFATDAKSAPFIKMGDVNGDGKVTATDARIALRMAANLDSKDNVDIMSVDATGDGKITASDARIILRNAAHISEFTYGFDGNGISNTLKALKSNTFVFDVSNNGIDFKIVKKNDNVHIVSADINSDLSSMGMENCGMMYCDGELYMTYVSNGMDIAMYIPESLYGELGMSADEIDSFVDSITSILPNELGVPEQFDDNGTVKYKYVVEEEGGSSVLVVDNYGILETIEYKNFAGMNIDAISVKEISAEVDSNYFSLDRFQLI